MILKGCQENNSFESLQTTILKGGRILDSACPSVCPPVSQSVSQCKRNLWIQLLSFYSIFLTFTDEQPRHVDMHYGNVLQIFARIKDLCCYVSYIAYSTI